MTAKIIPINRRSTGVQKSVPVKGKVSSKAAKPAVRKFRKEAWEYGKKKNPKAKLEPRHLAAIEFVFQKMTQDKASLTVLNACRGFKAELKKLALSYIQYGHKFDLLSSCDEGPTHLLVIARERSSASSFRIGDNWHLHINDDDTLTYGNWYHCSTNRPEPHETVWTAEKGFLPCDKDTKPGQNGHRSGTCRCFRSDS